MQATSGHDQRDRTHHVFDDIWKQATAVFPNGMVRNDPLDGVCPFIAILRVELLAQLPVLPCLSAITHHTGMDI